MAVKNAIYTPHHVDVVGGEKITSLGVVTLRIFHFFSEYLGNQYPQKKFDEINLAFQTPPPTHI